MSARKRKNPCAKKEKKKKKNPKVSHMKSSAAERDQLPEERGRRPPRALRGPPVTRGRKRSRSTPTHPLPGRMVPPPSPRRIPRRRRERQHRLVGRRPSAPRSDLELLTTYSLAVLSIPTSPRAAIHSGCCNRMDRGGLMPRAPAELWKIFGSSTSIPEADYASASEWVRAERDAVLQPLRHLREVSSRPMRAVFAACPAEYCRYSRRSARSRAGPRSCGGLRGRASPPSAALPRRRRRCRGRSSRRRGNAPCRTRRWPAPRAHRPPAPARSRCPR